MTAPIEITGKRFGKLTVLRRDGSTSYGQSKWLCQCDCGISKSFPWASLKRHDVNSCGCEWRKTFEHERICPRCKLMKPNGDFRKGNSGKGLASYCNECLRKYQVEQYHKNREMILPNMRAVRAGLRAKVITAYGSNCACCSEGELMFLAVDHKNNDGAKHRKEVGVSDRFYRWLIRNNFPPEFQLLCANCNWGKYVNGGVCPHQSRKLVCVAA